MSLKFTDLPFDETIFNLTEAMQYSLSDYHKITDSSSNYQKQNHEYWFKQVITLTNGHTARQIENYKREYINEFEKNPLLLGILDLYLNVYNATSKNDCKMAYEAYQNLQNQYPFENNMQNYFDMGCRLSTGLAEKVEQIKVSYPLFLYNAYTKHGGKDDDHRGGYLYPTHKLTDEQILELHETNPELFKSEKVKTIYEKLQATINASQPSSN